jgi:hypothetical protein
MANRVRSAVNISIRANGALSEHRPARHRWDEACDRRSSGGPASWDARLRYGRICRRPACARMQEFPCQPGIARRQAGSRVHNYCFDKILAVCARPARSYLPVSKAFRPSVVRSCFIVRGKPNADDAPMRFKSPRSRIRHSCRPQDGEPELVPAHRLAGNRSRRRLEPCVLH